MVADGAVRQGHLLFGGIAGLARQALGKIRKLGERGEQNVCVMCPMTCYDSDHYSKSVSRIRERVGTEKLILPSGLYKSNEDWLKRWPSISRTVKMGVVFGEPETALVGKGVVHEVDTLRQRKVPIYWLKDDGSFSDTFHFELHENGWSWKKYAVIRS